MQPTLFVVGSLADINFVHVILEAIEVDVSAGNLYQIEKVRYKSVDKRKKHKISDIDKTVKLQGCIFTLPSTYEFNYLKEFITLNIETQSLYQKFKVNFYYNIVLIDNFIDTLKFKAGDATFSSFLKASEEFNILIQDHI